MECIEPPSRLAWCAAPKSLVYLAVKEWPVRGWELATYLEANLRRQPCQLRNSIAGDPVVQRSAFRALVPVSSYGIPTGQGSRASRAYTKLNQADSYLPICEAGTSAPQADFYCCSATAREGTECVFVWMCAPILPRLWWTDLLPGPTEVLTVSFHACPESVRASEGGRTARPQRYDVEPEETEAKRLGDCTMMCVSLHRGRTVSKPTRWRGR